MHTVIYKGGKHKSNYFENIPTPAVQSSNKTDLMDVDVNSRGKEKQRTIHEIKKDFETYQAFGKPNVKDVKQEEDPQIPVNLVKEIKKSFENMKLPDPPTEEELKEVKEAESTEFLPPVVPKRSSSYRKAPREVPSKPPSESKTNLEKTSPQSRSVTSVADNCNDEGYATFPNSPRKPGRPVEYLDKTYVPEKSISNVDLTDSENNGLDETFGKMHEKVHSLGNSNEMVQDEYGFVGYKSLPYVNDSLTRNQNKYNRAYLTISKAGDVKEKLNHYESKLDGNQLRSLPAVDRKFIQTRVTNPNKVVIRGQEVPDVSSIKQRLESYEKDKDLFDYCAGMLTKEKLKYFCKKVGHSR